MKQRAAVAPRESGQMQELRRTKESKLPIFVLTDTGDAVNGGQMMQRLMLLAGAPAGAS